LFRVPIRQALEGTSEETLEEIIVTTYRPTTVKVLLTLVLTLGFFDAGPTQAEGITRMEFLGEATLSKTMQGSTAPVGGLSGITYSPFNDLYFVISDDRSEKAPARFYTVAIDLRDGRLNPGDLAVREVTELIGSNDELFAAYSLDPEGIAMARDGSLFISSEGFVDNRIPPFIRAFSSRGVEQRDLPIPRRYRPRRDGGIRHNQGFEALALSADGTTLWSAPENALLQDGPRADLDVPSPARILKFDATRGRLEAEYLYWVDPVLDAPVPSDALRTRGLVELLALGDDSLLALERAYSAGVGHQIVLYRVTIGDADNIIGVSDLDTGNLRAVRKELLFDFAALDRPLDNVEGMTFGPRLPDGRRTLILVSDDNFNPEQANLFFAFAVTDEATTIQGIQGRSHRSPYAGQWATDVGGIVTAVSKPAPKPASTPNEPADSGQQVEIWIQHPRGDGDPASSDGILVVSDGDLPQVQPGDAVRVSGLIEEIGPPGTLPVTRLLAYSVFVQSRGNALPPAVVLGQGGRVVPDRHIDDDGLRGFDPADDTIDFFESLEGMRVAVPDPVVVGPTTRFGGLALLADNGGSSFPRSPRGGVVLTDGSLNPERLLVNTRLAERIEANVGDRLSGSITGVMGYDFGSYSIFATPPLPSVTANGRTADTTTLKGDAEHLTVATYNVLNLDAKDPAAKFQRLARGIVQDLSAPDILALQEIQDDSGPEDDGVVEAQVTLGKLITAIEAAGGPTYAARQINPENNADGGQPGGNIRVAYLFNPQRVLFIDRGTSSPRDAVAVEVQDGGPRLSLSPGRVSPNAPSFAGDSAQGFEGNRKSLAAEVFFQGNQIFLVNNHLKSKRGDDRVFGLRQPPVPSTETQRSAQTALLRTFADQILGAGALSNVIVLGDMNEHEFRAPMTKLTEQRPGRFSLTNLMEWVPVPDRYTYNYLGNSQVLDNVFISPNLVVNASPEVDIVHINSDFSSSESASDHDPVLIRLHLPPKT